MYIICIKILCHFYILHTHIPYYNAFNISIYCIIFYIYIYIDRLYLAPLTLWKFPFPLRLNSHCIMSKKMGIVAFLSSGSGTSVTSRIGPTMAGMNLILWGPARDLNSNTPSDRIGISQGLKHIIHTKPTLLKMWILLKEELTSHSSKIQQ